MPTAHHLRIPAGGPERMAALDRLANALFRQLGGTAARTLCVLLDELSSEAPDAEAPQEPVQGRQPMDVPTHVRERDRRPTPAAGRPLP